MFYLYIFILFFQITITFLLFYILFFKRKIERFSNNLKDSEIRRIHNYDYSHELKNLADYNENRLNKNEKDMRAHTNGHTTFLNFHFHAADAGFLRIGDFLLNWGLGGNGTGGRKSGDFVKSYSPAKVVGVFTNPVGSGAGNQTLRIKHLGSDHFSVSDADPCEHPYFFMAYGFKPISNEERGIVKITYNENQEHLLPKRMKYLADTKGDFKYDYIVNENNDETIPGGC